MSKLFGRLRRFLRELKRRKVYRVAATYAVVGFVLIQVADLTFVRLGLPSWTVTFVIVLVAVGFPLSLVLAWAFEVTPEGVRRTPEAGPVETKATAGTRTAYKVLLGLGLVAAVVAGGWYLTGGGGEDPEISEGTVAVLPFQISGSASEEWRDGMVSLLSTGLDGAAGLRAMPDQTVLATWERSAPDQAGVTVEEALAAARRTGARYGVVGTVTGLGSELQLSAAAYETTSGDRLGQVEVTGTPDRVTALAGELTRRVLGLLAAETGEELRAADLASVTTQSDTALRAFLAGERHNRHGAYDSAVTDYQTAIRADSSFALPFARLSVIGLWHPDFQGQHIRKAYELSDQLPERQRRLVQALYLGRFERRTLAAADSLRRLTEDYPDDPGMWFSLGDLIYNAEIPGGLPEVERVHGRAIQLDPSYSPYHDHYVQAAFVLHHDSALAAQRLQAMPNERLRRLFRLGLQMTFGDSAQRQRVLTAYDTVPVPGLWAVSYPLGAPQDGALVETVLRRIFEREEINSDRVATFLFINDLTEGQIHQALADRRRRKLEGDFIACRLAAALTLGRPVPDSSAAASLAPENLPDEPSPNRLRCAALYLMESERGVELEGLIQRLRATVTVDTTGVDGVPPGKLEAVIQELRGYRAWKQGNLDRAAALWDRSNESGHAGAIWRGDLYRQRDEFDTAEGWYLAAWHDPVAHERLGRLYEEINRPEKAAAAYRRFIEGWKNADPELQPRVEAARKRLQQLTGSQSATNE